jgi:hypothetical protein
LSQRQLFFEEKKQNCENVFFKLCKLPIIVIGWLMCSRNFILCHKAHDIQHYDI